ncbi:hypothetical protein GZL_00122 [Streptomyces sp. 769]|nr:hypothetical protein GZL_00122 [Streptomyces sp. 769]
MQLDVVLTPAGLFFLAACGLRPAAGAAMWWWFLGAVLVVARRV